MSNSPTPALVFISHASADRAFASAVCESLETAGIQCWIAPRDVKGGRFYPSEIVQAIRRSNVFLLIFSEGANGSDQVLQEVERATHLRIPILAIRLGTVTPSDSFAYFLGVRHWVEPGTGADGAVDFAALREHVAALLPENLPKHTSKVQQDFEVFGHFRIMRREDGSLFRLGKGGMGETFKARDTILDRTVALKVISSALLGSTSVRERFLREAKAAAKIQHPHVATVHHFGQEGDTYYYAMEFVDGEDLERYVQTRGPLPAPLALRVTYQVAQGLEAADEHKLIHRDIKPSNIMAVWKKDLNIKLIDFGLAKNIDPRSLQESVLSGRGDFLGTVPFASPEQCKAAVLDIRSDIYSLGVTLWYLLTGERPFSGSVAEVIGSHLYRVPPFERLQGIPEPLVVLLRRMLEKEPAARPQTPETLQEEIEKITSELASEFAGSIKPPEPIKAAPAKTDDADLINSVAVDAPGFINYSTPNVGAVLAEDYQIDEEVAEGLGGRLFRVSGLAQERAKVPLAIKLLHPALADATLLNLLSAEIDLLFQARHEHLITYFAFERETASPFFVREWVHGVSLLDLLRWKGSLKAAELVQLLSGVAETLDFASEHGLGLFEFTLRKSFVACPAAVEPARFREFARGELAGLADCGLKLNPLSLAPLLFRNRGVWINSTLLPDSRIQSLTQAAAGIEANKGAPLLARMIYELLSGHPFLDRGATGYTPLPAINEAGNNLLRRAIAGPAAASLADCRSFWQAFASSLDLAPRVIPPVLPAPAPLYEETQPKTAPDSKPASEQPRDLAKSDQEAPAELSALERLFKNLGSVPKSAESGASVQKPIQSAKKQPTKTNLAPQEALQPSGGTWPTKAEPRPQRKPRFLVQSQRPFWIIVGLVGLAVVCFLGFFVRNGASPQTERTRQSGESLTEAESYFYGRGVTQDYSKALNWYEKAADLGNGAAMFSLGWMYEKGEGVARDYQKAREWYQKGASAGNEMARAALARLEIQKRNR
jgi:serine/threonine protein kinase